MAKITRLSSRPEPAEPYEGFAKEQAQQPGLAEAQGKDKEGEVEDLVEAALKRLQKLGQEYVAAQAKVARFDQALDGYLEDILEITAATGGKLGYHTVEIELQAREDLLRQAEAERDRIEKKKQALRVRIVRARFQRQQEQQVA